MNGDDPYLRIAESVGLRKLVILEVLSRPADEKLPLSEQEFFELCVEESDDIWRPRFIVKQTRGQWIEVDQQVMWEGPECERWPTLKKAKEEYNLRLQALKAKGFTQSDMDF